VLCIVAITLALISNSLSLSSIFVYSPYFFFFNDSATTEIYTLSLHDALPILYHSVLSGNFPGRNIPRLCSRTDQHVPGSSPCSRSEEHTSELQSRENLVCRLLLEKKKQNKNHNDDV